MQLLIRCALLTLGFATVVGTVAAEDWVRFRGPHGRGVSDERVATSWSAEKNIVWKTKMPGLGTSSPITLGDRIFLTCYSGYAENVDNPGEMKDLMRHVVCIDRADGKVVWSKEFQPELPESKYRGGNDSWHGYASSTPTTDGEHLYVFFGKSGVYCLDLEGNEVWNASVGEKTRGWGSSNSLLLHGDLVIVNASIEGQSLVALNKKTGEKAWSAGGIRGCWNTPVIVEAAGKSELVLSLPNKVVAFDPESGDQLWNCEGIPDGGYVCPSAVADAGVVYLIGGRKNTAMAIKAGGRGDVTDTHLLWTTGKGSNVSSPVLYDGHLYWLHERRGMLYCLNAKNGEVAFQERLESRPGIVYASIIVADGKLYAVSQHKGTYVFDASPEFKLLSHNVIDNDDSRSNAGLVVSKGQLLLRNDSYLYCIGEK